MSLKQEHSLSLSKTQQSVEIEERCWVVKVKKAWTWGKRAETACTNAYIRAIIGYPLVVIALCFVVCLVLTICGFVLSPVPSFSNPTLGFEVKGNEISGARLAWMNLQHQTSDCQSNTNNGYFRRSVLNSYCVRPQEATTKSMNSTSVTTKSMNSTSVTSVTTKSMNSTSVTTKSMNSTSVNWTTIFPTTHSAPATNPNCDSLIGEETERYLIRIILKSKSSSDLITQESITDLCRINDQLMKTLANDIKLISYRMRYVNENDPSWSLAGAATCYNNLSSCPGLSAMNIKSFNAHLTDCNQYRKSIIDCFDHSNAINFTCSYFPANCSKTWLASTLKYVVSSGKDSQGGSGPFTIITLPALTYEVAAAAAYKMREQSLKTSQYVNFADRAERISARSSSFDLKGIHVGDQGNFVQDPIFHDNLLAVVALVLVWFLILLYSGSLFFSVMVCLSLALSLGVAFALYHQIFRIPFFPFLNMMIVVLLLGIGADDAVILSHSWQVASNDMGDSEDVTKIASEAFRHSLLSMFVTSAATAAAFYSNIVSNVTAIKCFGVFAGSVIMVNFVLVLLFLAPSMVIQHTYLEKLWTRLCPQKVHGCTGWMSKYCQKVTSAIFHRALPALVQSFAPIIVVLSSILMILAFIATAHWPGISFPKSETFSFFKPNHPFAWYDDNVAKYFTFAKSSSKTKLELILLWGFNPTYDARSFDPGDQGTVNQNHAFRMNKIELQKINSFLKSIINSSSSADHWIAPSDGQTWIDRFMNWTNQEPCSKTQPPICCDSSAKSFDEPNFSKCLLRWTSTEDENHDFTQGPIFNKAGSMAGFTWKAKTKFDFTIKYPNLSVIFEKISQTIKLSLDQTGAQAPLVILYPIEAMIWYNLQASVLSGLPKSFAISLAVVILTCIVSTCSLKLSLLTTVPIIAVISITLGILNVLRWELNIVVAVIVILAAGLCFDYALHFAVAYKLTPTKLVTCGEKVNHAMTYISLPITMAALTTGVAGLCLLGAMTNPYYQVGLFVVILTIIALVMSLIFFPALIVTVDLIQSCCTNLIKKCKVAYNRRTAPESQEIMGNPDELKKMSSTKKF